MTPRGSGFRLWSWIRAAGVVAALVILASCQSKTKLLDLSKTPDFESKTPDFEHQSPEELVQFLKNADLRASRAIGPEAIELLVQHGKSSIPAITVALDSFENDGLSPFFRNYDWLFLAYAKIEGPAAYPRLHRLSTNNIFWQFNFDTAIAVSQSLTSYQSHVRNPDDEVPLLNDLLYSHQVEQHMGALDLVIRMWQKGDPLFLERLLGSNARAALKKMVRNGSWERSRAGISHSYDRFAVGYRFKRAPEWQGPWDRIVHPSVFIQGEGTGAAVVDTQFVNANVESCGSFPVRFGFRTEPTTVPYVVDNSNFDELIGLIAACTSFK